MSLSVLDAWNSFLYLFSISKKAPVPISGSPYYIFLRKEIEKGGAFRALVNLDDLSNPGQTLQK